MPTDSFSAETRGAAHRDGERELGTTESATMTSDLENLALDPMPLVFDCYAVAPSRPKCIVRISLWPTAADAGLSPERILGDGMMVDVIRGTETLGKLVDCSEARCEAARAFLGVVLSRGLKAWCSLYLPAMVCIEVSAYRLEAEALARDWCAAASIQPTELAVTLIDYNHVSELTAAGENEFKAIHLSTYPVL